MKHLVSVTKTPSTANYGVFGLGPDAVTKMVPTLGAGFIQMGDLVDKWNGIITAPIDVII